MLSSNTPPNPTIFFKPGIETKFRIDFEHWRANDPSWKSTFQSYLCETHQQSLNEEQQSLMIDAVNPETGEVTQVDQMWDILVSHCAQQDDFILENATLTDSVFRALIRNANEPLSAEELSQIISKPAEVILKTISGPRVYRGIRPVRE